MLRLEQIISMVTELGKRGIKTYPIKSVPATLPKVLIAERRPTLNPTLRTDSVSNLTRKGTVMANNARGIKKRNPEAKSVAHANGNFIKLRQIGLTIGTVAARYTAAPRMA